MENNKYRSNLLNHYVDRYGKDQIQKWVYEFRDKNFGRFGKSLDDYFMMRDEMEYLKPPTLQYWHEDCESPPELYLYDAIKRRGTDKSYGLELIPQFHIGRKRVDFALKHPDDSMPVLVIEVDGRSFHHNPEADLKRILGIESTGIYALAFSGWKAKKSPDECTLEINYCLQRHLC